MNSKEIKAKVRLSDAFIITGRGLVFVGHLTEGNFIAGDLLEFAIENETYVRKITGIDFGRGPEDWQFQRVGILVRTGDMAELQKIRESFKGEIPAVIYATDRT